MTQPWTICPECGRGRGEDHQRDCSRSKRPPVRDYSKLAGNRGPETMRGVVLPLQPVTDEDGGPPPAPNMKGRATSVLER